MNQLFPLVALVVCALPGSAFSQTSFEFPANECAIGLVTDNYVACVGAVANNIWKIHQWGEDTPMTICKNQCTGNLKGRISKLKWKWDAELQCQNRGQGVLRQDIALSRSGAMEGSIKDWISKASHAGKIKADDFIC